MGVLGSRRRTYRKPVKAYLGEIRRHKHSGLFYQYMKNPHTGKMAWIRYDTFYSGTWNTSKGKTARPTSLIRLTGRVGRTRR